MRDKKIFDKAQMPKCDLCNATDQSVMFDAPTIMGPWANMCQDCYKKHGRSTRLGQDEIFGTRFVLTDKPETSKSDKVLLAVECNTFEELLMDSVREVMCPECNTGRTVEPDAGYTFECEGCQAKVRCASLM